MAKTTDCGFQEQWKEKPGKGQVQIREGGEISRLHGRVLSGLEMENRQELFYSEASLSAVLSWDITGCFGTFNFTGNE